MKGWGNLPFSYLKGLKLKCFEHAYLMTESLNFIIKNHMTRRFNSFFGDLSITRAGYESMFKGYLC